MRDRAADFSGKEYAPKSACDGDAHEILAVFDFDGTLTKQDTFNDFLIWRFGRIKFYLAMLLVSPLIFLYVCRVLPNSIPKGSLFWLFFRNRSYQKFSQVCAAYGTARLNDLLREEAMEKLRWHVSQGHTVVIVSASILEWIAPWANRNAINDVIATEIEVAAGIMTGRFRSKNCYGIEKAHRLLARYPNIADRIVYAYGDSRGDRDMLRMATYPFYRKFY